MSRLDDKLAALATMSPAQLRGEWLRLYKTPASDMTPDLLRRGIAYRLQEQAFGGFNKTTMRRLKQLCQRMAAGSDGAPELTIKPGTRLVRDWGGVAHHVLVIDDGYLYREQRYRSLSEIARAITGAKWSGPRFFGLVRRSGGKDA